MLKTKRLHIRPMSHGDSEQVFQYRKDIEANMFQNFVPRALEEVDTFISKLPDTFNETGTWYQLAICNEAEMVIGDIGIHFVDSDQCELGFTLNKLFQNKGYATEAISAIIDYLFNQLNKHRIFCSVDPRNTSSVRLMQRLKLRKEAHFKESYLFKGEWVDDVIYAILKHEWQTTNK